MYATSVKWGKWLLSHPPKFFPIPTAFQMSVGIFAKHSIKNILQCDFLLYIFLQKENVFFTQNTTQTNSCLLKTF